VEGERVGREVRGGEENERGGKEGDRRGGGMGWVGERDGWGE